MNKLYVLMGKSCTGKDTLCQELLDCSELNIKGVVGYTTRPIRSGEKEGVEYNFVNPQDTKRLHDLRESGKIIEERVYKTEYGDWLYFTVDDGQIDFTANHLMIGTLESCKSLQSYYGEDLVIPIYIEVDDAIRLQRSLNRENSQKNPKYTEMCRRYLADNEDFSEDRLASIKNIKRINNDNGVSSCLEQISEDIMSGFKNRKRINNFKGKSVFI